MLFLIISTPRKKGTQAELYYCCFDVALEFANKANLPNNLHIIPTEFSLSDNNNKKKVLKLSAVNN